MTHAVKLECSHADYHAIGEAVQKTRDGSESVRVPRAALVALLLDHQRLCAAFKDQIGGIK